MLSAWRHTNIRASSHRIAEETSAGRDDPGPWIAANALTGVHRALVAYVRQRIVAGDDSLPDLARDVRSFGESAFSLLAGGLGGYAPKPPAAEGHR